MTICLCCTILGGSKRLWDVQYVHSKSLVGTNGPESLYPGPYIELPNETRTICTARRNTDKSTVERDGKPFSNFLLYHQLILICRRLQYTGPQTARTPYMQTSHMLVSSSKCHSV